MNKVEQRRKDRMEQIKKNKKKVTTGCGGCRKRRVKK